MPQERYWRRIYLQPALKPPNNNIVPILHTDVRIVGSIQPLLFAEHLLSSSYSSARETHPTKRLIPMQFDLLSQRIRLGRTAAKLFRSGEEIVQMAQHYGAISSLGMMRLYATI